MPSISRQYHPLSCSLEITAQTSPLSRWAGRPILKSVNFLLSFRELPGQNQEPLEIRGNHQQLQLLSETVTHYVQERLGQSLTTASGNPAIEMTAADTTPASKADTTPSQLYLRPRSLVTHDLVLGSLSTNAEHQTVSLKATQLFDLVSALDDCTAELEVLPLSTPSQRPAIPVWASSAAVIVLMLGVSTATLQLTRQNPADQRERVTSTDPSDVDTPSRPSAKGLASAPKGNTTPHPSLSQPSNTPGLRSTPAAESKRRDPEAPAKLKQPSPPIVASAPRPETIPSSIPSKPQIENETLNNRPAPPPQKDKALADQRLGNQQPNDQSANKRLREPVAVAPSTGAEVSQKRTSSPRPAAAPPPRPAAEPAPKPTADSSITASELQEADRFNGRSIPQRSVDPLGQQAPESVAESAYVRPQTAHLQNIRQYLSPRWQAPLGLTQPLKYQLTLNPNGSLQQVKPLDSVAAQYLDQVPLPAVNQPFIAPLQPSQTTQVRLILKPDGVVQLMEGASAP
ncbi:DUF4335 domain-containing protein [Acaryochloris sp. IP29b_bin.137]|uniref:DUF4335 domain-containing protein n=1 Tax=Acaryochloris sp. IP29b_bin.137 TaxID=2969217 RepID=UPI00263821C1|nr:DUF4335 domain-containing protein [Acaryochloris sp. IP29b_bin.137]